MQAELFGYKFLATIIFTLDAHGKGSLLIERERFIPADFIHSFEVNYDKKYCMVFLSNEHSEVRYGGWLVNQLRQLAKAVIAHEGHNVWYSITSEWGMLVCRCGADDIACENEIIMGLGGYCNTPLTAVYPPYKLSLGSSR